jgi:histidinol-phosphate/aromatic aminotransferase/cobyric acid decarboxylase-like protein
MSFTDQQTGSMLSRGLSRRQIGRIAGMFSAGIALPFSEFAMAQQADRRLNGRREMPPDAVRISSNENPLGPCAEGLEAMAKIGPLGGRYSPSNEQGKFIQAVAETESVKEDYVASFAGSSDPLFRVACAYTSPTRSWVMADPGYGSGAPKFIGSKVIKVPLRADNSHDVEAMIKADPNAGTYYVCNPNNPSGTLTPRKDIEYLLANKPKDAIVVLDEAYTHFSAKAERGSDLVAADKDVVVLRTFSKVYGMAGIRAGFAMGRPDLLDKLRPFGIGMLPITGLACATASLGVKNLVAERREINRRIRENTFEFLEKQKISYILSETNFFMMEVGRPGAQFAKAMAEQKVFIGRVWPVWPTKVRVTVGTQDDMDKFKAAVLKVMA